MITALNLKRKIAFCEIENVRHAFNQTAIQIAGESDWGIKVVDAFLRKIPL